MVTLYLTERTALLVSAKLLEKYGREKKCRQMGNERKTVQSLELVKTDLENNLLFVKGAIPGATGSMVRVIPAVKKVHA